MFGNLSRHRSDATVERFIAGEHAIIREHLDYMRSIADNVPFEIPVTLRDRLDVVLSFLHNDLVSHLKVEDEVLYPVFDRMADAGWSSPAMRFDHEMITSMLGQLDEAIADTQRARWLDEVQRLLFVLEGVVRLHLAKEERLARRLLAELDSRASAPLRRLLAGTRSSTTARLGGSPVLSPDQIAAPLRVLLSDRRTLTTVMGEFWHETASIVASCQSRSPTAMSAS
jgi:hemerythrin-like domain-containing protein